MDRSDLEIFRAVTQEGSITRAARRLNFVQSNVTAQIKKLESELRVPLFFRHSRGVTLTPAGKTLLTHAERILRLFEEASRAVRGGSEPGGRLAIGSMETTAAVRLPPALAAYHSRYPEVDLALTTGPTEHLVEAVLNYQLDGALVAGPVQHPALAQEPVIEEELVLISGPSHPLGTALGSLVRHPIHVFRTGCSYRARLELWLRTAGFLPVRIVEFGTLEGILGSVRAGFGVSLVPRSVTRELEAGGMVVCHPIPEPYGRVNTVFVRRHDVPRTPTLELFLEMLRSSAVRGESREIMPHGETYRKEGNEAQGGGR
jgi:LysR family transcriptional regulator, cell division regulator